MKGNGICKKNGIPTGGSLCVELANITVFYIMNKVIYSDGNLMKPIKHKKRYIDDGAGFFVGSHRLFKSWVNSVNLKLAPFGLFIDECVIKDNGCFIPFLDIQFCMDSEGKLQTDLYIKPTDSRSYLHFSSTHPNHVYTGIVYSQCIRLRRIINSQVRLEIRMKDVCESFIKGGYPTSMVENISKKVLNQPRLLDKTLQINIPQNNEKNNI